MAETFTMQETPVNSEILNSDEKDSLAVAESLEGGEQPLLAGKFKDSQALEQAYVELQKKLGEPKEEEESKPEPEQQAEEEESSEPEEPETEDQAQALTKDQAKFLMNMVGGEKAYKSMLEWASQNFSKEEQK